jgi:hypothetical protein
MNVARRLATLSVGSTRARAGWVYLYLQRISAHSFPRICLTYWGGYIGETRHYRDFYLFRELR